jgi:hypothetical protein
MEDDYSNAQDDAFAEFFEDGPLATESVIFDFALHPRHPFFAMKTDYSSSCKRLQD